jgi:hypothetical protein
MNVKEYADLLRLYSEHLSQLTQRLTAQLTELEDALAAYKQPTDTAVEAELDGTIKLSGHIADESARLKGYLQAWATKGKTRSAILGQIPTLTLARSLSVKRQQ